MGVCEIGMVTCLIDDPNLKYELMSFCSIVLLPLALTVRLAIDEMIFQKWRGRFENRLSAISSRLRKTEGWLTIIVAENRKLRRELDKKKGL